MNQHSYPAVLHYHEARQEEHLDLPENANVRKLYHELCSKTVGVAPLREVMFTYVRYVIARSGGNKSNAAKALRVDRRSLGRWLVNGAISAKART